MFSCLIFIALSAGLVSASSSCTGRCNENYNPQNSCHCNDECGLHQNCCSDYHELCNTNVGTCAGRCETSLDTSQSCQCNSACLRYGDCCPDYTSICSGSTSDSCNGRCGQQPDDSKSCQCNSVCSTYGDCCPDYSTQCNAPTQSPTESPTQSPPTTGGCSSQTASNQEIYDISLQLFDSDYNRASPEDYDILPQDQTSQSSSNDNSPANFFSYVNEDFLFSKPTYSSLIDLLDNYNNRQGNTEDNTEAEQAEEDEFLDAFLATAVGEAAFNFLNNKGYAGGSHEAFKDNLRKIWFGKYSRQATHDTSGFEHVFVGELKSSSVSGFHNWVQFYLEEKAGRLNYYGYISTLEPDIYGMQFTWEGYIKEIGGGAIGVSPEYELAVFTICHVLRPGSQCQIQMRDNLGAAVYRKIQTWSWSNSKPDDCFKYVSSAYFLS